MTNTIKYEVTGMLIKKDDTVVYGIVEYTHAESKKKAMNNIGYRLGGRIVGNAVEVVTNTNTAYEQISLF
jgi:hypothetical protein